MNATENKNGEKLYLWGIAFQCLVSFLTNLEASFLNLLRQDKDPKEPDEEHVVKQVSK